jgi:hypothetical protein
MIAIVKFELEYGSSQASRQRLTWIHGLLLSSTIICKVSTGERTRNEKLPLFEFDAYWG